MTSSGWDVFRDSDPIARKEHICRWCGEKILIGEKYHRYCGRFEGEWQDTKMHLECSKAPCEDDYLPEVTMKRGSILTKMEAEG